MKKSEDIFAKGVKDIEAGRSSVKDCLIRDSSMREQLKPLLQVVPIIREPWDVKVCIDFGARFCVKERINGSRL